MGRPENMLNNRTRDLWRIWGIAFLYTCIVSVFVQFILLPFLLPRLHAGGGLFIGSPDCLWFYQMAIDMAEKIKTSGWAAWELRPQGQAPAGIAAFIFALTWSKLWVLIPLNAALHASAFIVLFQLLNLLIKDQTKSLLCALPFLIFPSNLQWTSQLHKDGFSILGIVLFLQGIISLSRVENYETKKWFHNNIHSLIFSICGIILIWIVRPFTLTIMRPFAEVLFCLLFLTFLIRTFKKEISWQKILSVSLSMLLISFVLSQKTNLSSADFRESILASDSEEEMVEYEIEEVSQPAVAVQPIAEKPPVKKEAPITVAKEEARATAPVSQPALTAQPIAEKPPVKKEAPIAVAKKEARQKIRKPETKRIKVKVKKLIKKDDIENHWKRSFWLPLFIENKACFLAQVRRGFRSSSPEAKSNIDHDVGFGSVKDILIYLPRAAQIVLLAPFPNQWLSEGSSPGSSFMRKISAFEMAVVYFALIFLPYAIWYWRKRIEIWIIFIFCIYMMLVYGLVVCNIGTLYRMRYVYITTLVALGIAGFISLLDQLTIRKND